MKGINEFQLSLFDELENINETKESSSEEHTFVSSDVDYNDKVLKSYDHADRIVKLVSGRYLVEIEKDIFYLDKHGAMDYRVKVESEPSILAIDEIIYFKKDYPTNKKQNEVLENIINSDIYNIDLVIKRGGDHNYILKEKDRFISINHYGWILEYDGDIKYSQNDIIRDLKGEKASTDIEKTIQVGDKVSITYGGIDYIGEVNSIYNNKETLNIIYDGKHSAFHISKVHLM